MRTFAFDFAGRERAIVADEESARLFLWNGVEVTNMPGEEVAALIRVLNALERVDAAKSAPRRSRVGGWARALAGAL